MLIKICGIRSIPIALAAQAAGADLLGLVFAPSKRQVQPAEAAEIVAALRAAPPPHALIVGLFVHALPETITTVAAQIGLDALQLSGNEVPELAKAFALPVIKAVRMHGSDDETAWLALGAAAGSAWAGAVGQPQADRRARFPNPLMLVDAHVPGQYGGSGVTADWSQAALLAAKQPLLLAGGLHPENVAAAVRQVRPAGVDVSSGVETAGEKDAAKINAFIVAARAAAA